MSFPYIPHTEEDIAVMLETMGVDSLDQLFRGIPQQIQEQADLSALGPALSEQEILEHLHQLSSKNQSDMSSSSFLGGGIYRHFSPSVIDQLLLRGELLTSYTPYQPENAQGSLQIIFEFQTLVCQITGMEMANAGLYDASSGLVEAVLCALRVKKNRQLVVLSQAISPWIRDCVKTILKGIAGSELVELGYEPESGQVNQRELKELLSSRAEEVACVALGYPNYFGVVENLAELVPLVQDAGALAISLTNEALALSLFEPPGSFGVDISTGDLQSFGVAPNLGGPTCGFFACKKQYLRQVPGRICGRSTDAEGNRAFVLTLSTREQHIRRDKATSNICTNHALLAVCVTIYLSLLGPRGLKELGEINFSRRAYLENKLRAGQGKILFGGPRFNEFTYQLSPEQLKSHGVANANELINKLARENNTLIGPALETTYPELKNSLLLSVTELNKKETLDELANLLG